MLIGPDQLGESGANDLAVSLQTDQAVYRLGERVVLTLTVTNRGAQPLQLRFPSAQVYDFAVQRGGEEVWRWSRDHMFAAVLTEVLLPPGQSRSYTETWDQTDPQGRPVLPGIYQVEGWLVKQDPPVSQSLTITVR